MKMPEPVTAAPPAQTADETSIRRQVVFMVLVALAVRLTVMLFAYPDHLDPYRQHWRFAWEMGMVARSIVTGKGFSSPYVGETGPTAWFPPLYPYLLAGIFKVFGLFSRASAIAALSLNSLFSALTVLPIVAVARQTISVRVAKVAGWLWVFFPYSIWAASDRIWENCLTALLLACLIWFTLVLDERNSWRHWAGYGALWGVAALTNPTVFAVLPFLLAWLAWRRHRRGERWLGRAALAVGVILVVIAPWDIRNYVVFHKILPLRDNFWVEVRVGNTADLSDIYPDWSIPSTSAAQWNELHRVGEIAYIAEMRDVALQFIREHPWLFLWLTWKRIVFTWTGYWSLERDYASHEPFQIPNMFFCTAFTVLMLRGLVLMWRRRREWLAPYLAVVGAFPAVYYITHPTMDYRHPIDPVLVILSAYAVAQGKGSGWRRSRREAQLRPG